MGPLGLISGAFKGLIPLYLAKSFLGETTMTCANDLELLFGKQEKDLAEKTKIFLWSAFNFLAATLIVHPLYLIGIRVQSGPVERSAILRRAHRN